MGRQWRSEPQDLSVKPGCITKQTWRTTAMVFVTVFAVVIAILAFR